MNDLRDPRLKVFCSPLIPEAFHAVTHANEIYEFDPFDVEAIHRSARVAFSELVARATANPRPSSGRILLLLGESGAGKTHLMRAFRHRLHSREQGYFSYMQMNTAAANYGVYILRNTLESFSKLYNDQSVESALQRLSRQLAQAAPVPDALTTLRDTSLGRQGLIEAVETIGDALVDRATFADVDLDVVRALLYLQQDRPSLRARALKWLRGEPLSQQDRRPLGDLPPRDNPEDALGLLKALARLIDALEGGALVVCVDQLEDVRYLDDPTNCFTRIIQTLVALAEVPNVVVLMACLEDFYYATSQGHLTQSYVDRVERDPDAVLLTAQRSPQEVRQLVARRLQSLFEMVDVAFDPEDSLYPFPAAAMDSLAHRRSRDVVDACRRLRELSIAQGLPPGGGAAGELQSGAAAAALSTVPPDPQAALEDSAPLVALERLWNDIRAATLTPDDDDGARLGLLAAALPLAGVELESQASWEATCHDDGGYVDLTRGPEHPDPTRIFLCERPVQGGALAQQLRRVQQHLPTHPGAIVRTGAFPDNPKTIVVQVINDLLLRGWRRVTMDENDWILLAALVSLHRHPDAQTHLQAWARARRPLTSLPCIQTLLDLNFLQGLETTPETSPPTVAGESPPPAMAGDGAVEPLPPHQPLVLGVSHRQGGSLAVDPEELRRPALVAGETAAPTLWVANVVEKLLLRGVPVVVLDHRGLLVNYADPSAWATRALTPRDDIRRHHLQAAVEVSLTVPGDGPLAVPPLAELLVPRDAKTRLALFHLGALAAGPDYGPWLRDFFAALRRHSTGPRRRLGLLCVVDDAPKALGAWSAAAGPAEVETLGVTTAQAGVGWLWLSAVPGPELPDSAALSGGFLGRTPSVPAGLLAHLAACAGLEDTPDRDQTLARDAGRLGAEDLLGVWAGRAEAFQVQRPLIRPGARTTADIIALATSGPAQTAAP